jgi:catechol 2,3-dioxygenase-like lactoylglutathione lyase family enzyme
MSFLVLRDSERTVSKARSDLSFLYAMNPVHVSLDEGHVGMDKIKFKKEKCFLETQGESGRILLIDNGRHRMNLPGAPIAHEGFFVTHFFTVRDQEKSKDFYVRILGGKVIKSENPCYIKLANTWIILNSGGGPTPDKPEVLLETPLDLNRVNSFLNLRVADVWACYKQWRDNGAFFLTEPLDNHGWEWRCYMRDPDGYLIEVGQYTQMALDRFKTSAS